MVTDLSYPTLSLAQNCIPGHQHVENNLAKGTNNVLIPSLMKLSSCEFSFALKITNMC